jgi:hypothetical protein
MGKESVQDNIDTSQGTGIIRKIRNGFKMSAPYTRYAVPFLIGGFGYAMLPEPTEASVVSHYKGGELTEEQLNQELDNNQIRVLKTQSYGVNDDMWDSSESVVRKIQESLAKDHGMQVSKEKIYEIMWMFHEKDSPFLNQYGITLDDLDDIGTGVYFVVPCVKQFEKILGQFPSEVAGICEDMPKSKYGKMELDDGYDKVFDGISSQLKKGSITEEQATANVKRVLMEMEENGIRFYKKHFDDADNSQLEQLRQSLQTSGNQVDLNDFDKMVYILKNNVVLFELPDDINVRTIELDEGYGIRTGVRDYYCEEIDLDVAAGMILDAIKRYPESGVYNIFLKTKGDEKGIAQVFTPEEDIHGTPIHGLFMFPFKRKHCAYAFELEEVFKLIEGGSGGDGGNGGGNGGGASGGSGGGCAMHFDHDGYRLAALDALHGLSEGNWEDVDTISVAGGSHKRMALPDECMPNTPQEAKALFALSEKVREAGMRVVIGTAPEERLYDEGIREAA